MRKFLLSAGGQTLLTVAGMGVNLAAVLVFTAVAARHLGPEGIARFRVVTSFYVLLSILAKLGLDEALAYQLPEFVQGGRKSPRPLIAYALGITAVASAILAAAVCLLGDSIERHLLPAPGVAAELRWAWPFLPALALLAVATGGFRGLGRSDLRTYFLNYGVSLLLLILLLAYARAGLTTATAYIVRIVPLVAAGAIAVAVALRFGGEPSTLGADRRRTLHAFAAATLGSTIMQFLMDSGDVLVGSNLVGAEVLGNYAVAAQLAGLGLLMSYALQTVIGPLISAALAGGREEDAVFLHGAASRWLLRGNVAILGLMTALRSEFGTLFGERFGAAPSIFAVLVVGQLVTASLGLNTTAMLARRHVKAEFALSAAAVAAFWAGSAFLSRSWGAHGVAAALAVVLGLGNLARLLVLGRAGFRAVFSRDMAHLILVAAAALGGMVAIERAWSGPGRPVMAAALFAALYAAGFMLPPLRRCLGADLRILLRS